MILINTISLSLSYLFEYITNSAAYIFNNTIGKVTELLLRTILYSNYLSNNSSIMKKREVRLIKDFQAEKLSCLKTAFLFKSISPNTTGNIFIFLTSKKCSNIHPRQLQHYLERGADVVTFDADVYKDPISHSKDLQKLIKYLKTEKKVKKIAVHSYCTTGQSAIDALAKLKDKNISLICDRVFGDFEKLATSMTIISKLWFIKDIIKRLDCTSIRNIENIPGKVLFMWPDNDVILDYKKGSKKGNLTKDLYLAYSKKQKEKATVVHLHNYSHWQYPYTVLDQKKLDEFLKENKILSSLYQSTEDKRFINIDKLKRFYSYPPLSRFKKDILPYLIKSWFQRWTII